MSLDLMSLCRMGSTQSWCRYASPSAAPAALSNRLSQHSNYVLNAPCSTSTSSRLACGSASNQSAVVGNGSAYSIESDDDFSDEVGTHSASRNAPEVAIRQSREGQVLDKVINSSVQTSPLMTTESGRSLDVEMSLSGDATNKMTIEKVNFGREITSSRIKIDSRDKSLPVVVKKPLSVNTPLEEDVFDSEDERQMHPVEDESSHPDLTTGLQALRKLISGRNLELAKDLAKQLYEWYPRNTDVLLECAYVERQRGDLVAAGALYSQAITAFESQKDFSYDYIRALQALGSIEARSRNAKRARVFFMESIHAARQAEQRSTEITGAGVYGLHAWARLEEQLGNFSKAQELLTRAAEMQPGNAVVHQSRALLEAKAHNWAAARHHFKLAVKTAPTDVKCWHAWAIFEAAQGRHQKMRKLFQKALEVDPTNVYSLQAWAHQEMLIGTHESKERARSLFHKCTQIEPRNLYSWQAWACMEKASRNFKKARELFLKCLEINSCSVVCLQAFANMERNLGNLYAAQKLLRKALKVDPENAAALMEAALVERALGNHELADKLFVLAGMADKRKSQVRNKMFHSRKEVMPWKAGKWKRDARTKVKEAKQKDEVKSNRKKYTNVNRSKKKGTKTETVVNKRRGLHVKEAEGAMTRYSRLWAAQLSGA